MGIKRGMTGMKRGSEVSGRMERRGGDKGGEGLRRSKIGGSRFNRSDWGAALSQGRGDRGNSKVRGRVGREVGGRGGGDGRGGAAVGRGGSDNCRGGWGGGKLGVLGR